MTCLSPVVVPWTVTAVSAAPSVIELGEMLEKGSTTEPPPPASELVLEELEEEVDEPLEPVVDVDPEFCALSAAVEFGAMIGICTGGVCVPSDFVRDSVT